ncbi:prion-inhibition and propagation-domain-containing protein [Podospora australis]|uniref:Prion-inhibition and propagation-domain-containing protein n=1 Tax=Podospora australis TaxID=1536484 RepID=A0AAN7AFP2_9PEZI|nr:prion-inhibition and propagation-domain-containing protein [Podospora australis]
MEVAGGIISLTWDVFDSTIRIFKFLTALVEMPKDCEKYRLQLIIEYNRVLAWGQAAGLIEVPEGSTLGSVLGLGAEGIELVAIVARIEWLLSEFREYNARYGNELNPYQEQNAKSKKKTGKKGQTEEKGLEEDNTSNHKDEDKEPGGASVKENDDDDEATATDIDVVKGVSSLAVSYEKKKKERRHLRGTNHIRDFLSKAGHNTKEIVTHPSRVRWLVIDEEEFKKLLEDLHFLTERLHELVRNHRDQRIDEITAKTYREMLLARNDIQDLRDMFEACCALTSASSSTSSNNPQQKTHTNYKNLQDLVQLKKLSRTSDAILAKLRSESMLDSVRLSDLNITVRKLTESDLSEDFEWNEDVDYPPSLSRPRGILTTSDGDIPVWVEWKIMGDFPPNSLKDKESALRTLALAEMLHLSKPTSLYAPTCLAYFDDREVSGAERYGWIFKLPEGSDYDTQVVSLYSLLGNRGYKPSLSQRISLASKLCFTVLNLHAVNWLHKGILSENVVFHFNEDPTTDGHAGLKYDPSLPLLSGFEFSRPVGTQTTARDTDIVWDLYRWPTIQRQRPTERNSRKTYDLYSLGLLLLEIAHWERLHVLMSLGRHAKPGDAEEKVALPNVPLDESKSVRDWLLGTKKGAPFETNPLKELRNIVGDRYAAAVERCLWAHGEKGFGVGENDEQSDDGTVGILLQQAFTERVVEELRGVSL